MCTGQSADSATWVTQILFVMGARILTHEPRGCHVQARQLRLSETLPHNAECVRSLNS